MARHSIRLFALVISILGSMGGGSFAQVIHADADSADTPFFIANDASNEYELRRSDGTFSIVLVKETNPSGALVVCNDGVGDMCDFSSEMRVPVAADVNDLARLYGIGADIGNFRLVVREDGGLNDCFIENPPTIFQVAAILVGSVGTDGISGNHTLGTSEIYDSLNFPGQGFNVVVSSGPSSLVGFQFSVTMDFTSFDLGFFAGGTADFRLANLQNPGTPNPIINARITDIGGNTIIPSLISGSATSAGAIISVDQLIAGGSVIVLHWEHECSEPPCLPPLAPLLSIPVDADTKVSLNPVLKWLVGPPVTITFDEVMAGTMVNGMVIADVTFGVISGSVQVGKVGPGVTTFISRPNLEGDKNSTLTFTFERPVFGVSYGFALNIVKPLVPDATTMTLLDVNSNIIGIFSADARPMSVIDEGINTGASNTPIARVVITFSDPDANRFALDNLTYVLQPNGLPLTTLGGALGEHGPSDGRTPSKFTADHEMVSAWLIGENVSESLHIERSADAHVVKTATKLVATDRTQDDFAADMPSSVEYQKYTPSLEGIPRVVHSFDADLGNLTSAATNPCLIVNGDFETGDFTGWTKIDSGNGTFVINDGAFVPISSDGPRLPCGGSFGVVTDQGGMGVHTLYQDVTISPTAISARLNWTDMIRNHTVFSDPNQEWRVEVWNPVDNTVLGSLFSTNPGDASLQGCTARSADLSPWIGQTIRIAFTEEDNLLFFNVHLDDVCIEVEEATGCNTTYDVLLDTQKLPTSLVCTNVSLPECNPGLLMPSTRYFWQVIAKTPAGPAPGPVWSFITACPLADSDPPQCAIDARQTSNLNDENLRAGWMDVKMSFDCQSVGVAPNSPSDFSISDPSISIVDVDVDGSNLRLGLSQPISPGQWTCIDHIATGQQVCLGYLPGDVDGDRTSGPSDILAILGCLKGVVGFPCDIWQTDVDRSSETGPADILRVIDLLNGTAAFNVWLDKTLPACPTVLVQRFLRSKTAHRGTPNRACWLLSPFTKRFLSMVECKNHCCRDADADLPREQKVWRRSRFTLPASTIRLEDGICYCSSRCEA